MDNNAVSLAAIALAGTICAGFFGMVNKLGKSIDKMSRATQQVANETKKGADEARQRNGHLADLIVKTADKPVTVQTVETQVVKEQK